MKKQLTKGRLILLLLMPFFFIPVLAFAFSKLGGGKIGTVQEKAIALNSSIPEPKLNADTAKNKTEYYDRAQKLESRTQRDGISSIGEKLGFLNRRGDAIGAEDQAKQIEAKLADLDRVVKSPRTESIPSYANASKKNSVSSNDDINRLEKLLTTTKDNRGEDQEMTQLNDMMQSILDIQYPQRVAERENKLRADNPESQFVAIPAAIAGNQKVIEGATVQLLLGDSVTVNGILIPKGQGVFGSCKLTNQRLLLEIKNIRMSNAIIPVDWTLYGLDGMPGLAAPEAVLTGALNQGTDNAVRGLGIGSFDQSITTQVAGAGLDAAKQLISRRVRKIKVKLKQGTPVLLRDKKSNRTGTNPIKK